MQGISFDVTEETGKRLVGAITSGLGHAGPKHHGIVIGRSFLDGHVYVAENCHDGYKLVSKDAFYKRYSKNAPVRVAPNDGNLSNIEVAQRALNELSQSNKNKYNLLTNNCESFSNRAMYGHSTSSQVVNTIKGLAALVGILWLVRKVGRSA